MAHSTSEGKGKMRAWIVTRNEADDEATPPQTRHKCDFEAFLRQSKASAAQPSADVVELLRWISRDVSLAGLAPCAPHAIQFSEIGPPANGHRARLLQAMGLDSLLIGPDEGMRRRLGRYYATLFSTGTLYVPFPKFFASLMRAFDAFQKSEELRSAGSVYCIWIDSYKKSSMWVTLLVLYALMCPELGLQRGWVAPRFLLVGFTKYAEDRVRELPANTVFVVLDDASYSGTQLNGFTRRLQKWKLSAGNSMRKCCVVVPFVSDTARSVIRDKNLCAFTAGEDMPSVDSAFKSLMRLRASETWHKVPSLLRDDERLVFFNEDLPFLAGHFYSFTGAGSFNPKDLKEDVQLAIRHFDFWITVDGRFILKATGLERFSGTPNIAAAFFADLPFNEPGFAANLKTRMLDLEQARLGEAGDGLDKMTRAAENALAQSPEQFQRFAASVRASFEKSLQLFRVIDAQNKFEELEWSHTLAVFEHRMADDVSVPTKHLRAFLGVEKLQETRLSYIQYLRGIEQKLKELAFRSKDEREVGDLEGVGASVDVENYTAHWFTIDTALQSLERALDRLRERAHNENGSKK